MSKASLNEIQRMLRQLPDYKQRVVLGVPVIRWPGWENRPYEIETMGHRPGWSEHLAARIISEMLDGTSYYEAVRKVTGKNINKKFSRGKKT